MVKNTEGFVHFLLVFGIAILLSFVGLFIWMRLNGLPDYRDLSDEIKLAAESEVSEDWGTYTNTNHGFSFQYPNDYYLEDTGDRSGYKLIYLDSSPIELPTAYGMGMITPFELNILNDISNVDEAAEDARTMFKQGQYSETEINGPVGYKFSGTLDLLNIDITKVYLQGENEVISIEFHPSDDFIEETFDQILSTFEFTDNSEGLTNNWETYVNEKHGFNISVPPNWNIIEENSNQISIQDQDQDAIVISHPQSWSPNICVYYQEEKVPQSRYFSSHEAIQIENMNVRRSEDGESHPIICFSEGSIFTTATPSQGNITYRVDNASESTKQEMDKIISTLRFTNE